MGAAGEARLVFQCGAKTVEKDVLSWVFGRRLPGMNETLSCVGCFVHGFCCSINNLHSVNNQASSTFPLDLGFGAQIVTERNVAPRSI